MNSVLSLVLNHKLSNHFREKKLLAVKKKFYFWFHHPNIFKMVIFILAVVFVFKQSKFSIDKKSPIVLNEIITLSIEYALNLYRLFNFDLIDLII